MTDKAKLIELAERVERWMTMYVEMTFRKGATSEMRYERIAHAANCATVAAALRAIASKGDA